MAPRYGWGKIGNRIYYSAPYYRGNYYTIISAISYRKVEAALYGEWCGNGFIFLNFIEQSLCPKLHKGNVVVMDNVAFHKINGVRELIEGAGARLIYLPPYSPDLNPIEMMWSKLKGYLRNIAIRKANKLQDGLYNAFTSITAIDLQGWFKHCGYLDQYYREAL